MPYRIRDDHPNYELRKARVRVARKEYECVLCRPPVYGGLEWRGEPILRGETYARISETRLPVCAAHFTAADLVEVAR